MLRDRFHFNACLVYVYSPGGAHPYSFCNERDALWVYHYPVMIHHILIFYNQLWADIKRVVDDTDSDFSRWIPKSQRNFNLVYN